MDLCYEKLGEEKKISQQCGRLTHDTSGDKGLLLSLQEESLSDVHVTQKGLEDAGIPELHQMLSESLCMEALEVKGRDGRVMLVC